MRKVILRTFKLLFWGLLLQGLNLFNSMLALVPEVFSSSEPVNVH